MQGADAKRLLNWCATADVSEEGQIYYTQMLNAAGKIEADVTVSHWEGGRFLVVATDTMHRRTEHWLRRQIEATGSNAVVTDVTGGFAQLNLQGPLSRQILQSATRADLSDAAFPFRAAREIEIGCARAVCTRLTYVGELGYELFIPTEMAAHVHETLLAAGADVGHAGWVAFGGKGYRDYGHDLDNTDTLLEAGLGFTAALDKPGGFLGQAEVERQKAAKVAALPQRLLQVRLTDPAPLLHHGEVVYRDGVPLGDVRAASYGHTLGGAVGLAMIRARWFQEAMGGISPAWVREGHWQVDVAGEKVEATASLRPMYDPKNERILQ